MTCGACGYRWESHARSQKSRCGRCRTLVYVPASVRHANEAGAPSRAPRSPERGPARSQSPQREAPAPAPVVTGDIETWELPCGHEVRIRVTWPADDDDGTGWERLGAVKIACPVCAARTTMADVISHAVPASVGRSAEVAGADAEPMPEATERRHRPPFTSPSRRPAGHTGGVTRPAPDPALPGSWAVRGGLGRWSCGHEGTIPTTADDARPEREPCPDCGRPGLVHQRTPQGWAPVTGRR